MRTAIARIFDYSLDGVIAGEGTDFFDYCRDLPDDPAQLDRTRDLYEKAAVHIMGRKHYQESAKYFPQARTRLDHRVRQRRHRTRLPPTSLGRIRHEIRGRPTMLNSAVCTDTSTGGAVGALARAGLERGGSRERPSHPANGGWWC